MPLRSPAKRRGQLLARPTFFARHRSTPGVFTGRFQSASPSCSRRCSRPQREFKQAWKAVNPASHLNSTDRAWQPKPSAIDPLVIPMTAPYACLLWRAA